jgi:hypothetical protein
LLRNWNLRVGLFFSIWSFNVCGYLAYFEWLDQTNLLGVGMFHQKSKRSESVIRFAIAIRFGPYVALFGHFLPDPVVGPRGGFVTGLSVCLSEDN